MMTSNLHNLPPNERLRVRLDNFYRLAEDALSFAYSKDGFDGMNTVLGIELDALCKLLSRWESKCKTELPLAIEEPRKVCWADEMNTMIAMANKTVLYEEEKRCFSSYVKIKMEEAGCIMEDIQKEMDAEHDPQMFASYGRRSLAEYNKLKWNPMRRDVQAKITMVSEAHQKKKCEALLMEHIGKLNGLCDCALAKNAEEIYYEALGRFIWCSVHNADTAKVDEVLYLVKTIEYLCGRLERRLTFLDKEIPADAKCDETVRNDRLREEMLQNQCAKASYRLGCLEDYLHGGFTVEWMNQMLDDMVKSEHSAIACRKMKTPKQLMKFIHQIAGVLKYYNVLDGCSYDEVVEAIGLDKPQKQSRKDYVRHMIDDEKDLQKWLENYISDYRKSLCVSPPA
ncbi:MAG: hypothetical protein IJZ38_02645 [Bacteroides sp.]|nr:hypothetical protein [Bacteroides sp.]